MHIFIDIFYLAYEQAKEFIKTQAIDKYIKWTEEKKANSEGKNHDCFRGFEVVSNYLTGVTN